MDYLAKPLRRKLESTVIAAQDVAEAAARSVLEHLGVGETNAPEHLTEEQRALRRRLRAHGRQLGDHRRPDGHQSIEHLVQETAYEHWHRMLFARFLAENNLLMHPDGVALTLKECEELAPDEGAANGWELAGRYASRMLPQIFRPDSPVLALTLAPEHQRALERLLAGLAPETFQAQDSLGWVYQFWQSKKKEEVNRSEVKIGANELPAVTQLFTEPYMVSFLLDNSLGAWWVANHPEQPRPVSLEYLRMIEVEAASSRLKQTEVETASSRFKRQDGASTIELSDEAHSWITRCKDLDPHVDDDGIVCIPTIRGEKPAAERLLTLLQAAYGDDWSAHKLNQLLNDAKAKGKGLDWWLRERFFEQHCKLFQHRPFIWHIWDGLKDGFAVLVNYHKLDHKTLETLIYTYLGDWIGLQERAVSDGVDGAELRLTAAQDLKKRLERTLEGEAPYDIFVRWKPLEQLPIGWTPDLNDGVRLSIRPFMTAEVLRHNKKPKLNIHWNKDRGKDVESAPWYRLGLEYGGKEGDWINDHHLNLAAKHSARKSAGDPA